MKRVIISEEKVIDLGKRCLSNLRDFVNNEYLLGFNEVKRLRTLYFMACQKVFSEKLKTKQNRHLLILDELLNKISNEVWDEVLDEKFWGALNYVKKSNEVLNKISNEVLNKISNEVWDEVLDEKFWEALNYVKKSKEGDESEVEEVFNTPVCDKYSRVKFSLKEIYKIFDLVEEGVNKCFELNEDLYGDIKDFVYIYEVYNFRYKSLDRF